MLDCNPDVVCLQEVDDFPGFVEHLAPQGSESPQREGSAAARGIRISDKDGLRERSEQGSKSRSGETTRGIRIIERDPNPCRSLYAGICTEGSLSADPADGLSLPQGPKEVPKCEVRGAVLQESRSVAGWKRDLLEN